MAQDNSHEADTESLLEGFAVLVTRPEGQASGLVHAIRRRGGEPIAAPMLVIQSRADDPAAIAAIDRLPDFHAVIFVSRNAAEEGMKLIRARGQSLDGHAVYAVGPGTGASLKALGIANVLSPPNEFTSEGLLKLPGLAARETTGTSANRAASTAVE